MTKSRPPHEDRYRNASEVGTFLFCQRAWMYERQGTRSEREPERAAGSIYHQQHGERVDVAQSAGNAGRLALLIAIVLIAFAIWMGLR